MAGTAMSAPKLTAVEDLSLEELLRHSVANALKAKRQSALNQLITQAKLVTDLDYLEEKDLRAAVGRLYAVVRKFELADSELMAFFEGNK
jgi:hypothetical protein